mmetsp:Transcript_58936/g.133438  ORF Transcript_58936/g.133438 Transcript_58936/m.133438 type:complete len:203 (-) Transcript_58936:467-1075(-)
MNPTRGRARRGVLSLHLHPQLAPSSPRACALKTLGYLQGQRLPPFPRLRTEAAPQRMTSREPPSSHHWAHCSALRQRPEWRRRRRLEARWTRQGLVPKGSTRPRCKEPATGFPAARALWRAKRAAFAHLAGSQLLVIRQRHRPKYLPVCSPGQALWLFPLGLSSLAPASQVLGGWMARQHRCGVNPRQLHAPLLLQPPRVSL